jgi:hypothetical protein
MAAASGPSCVWTHQNSAAWAPRAAIGANLQQWKQEQECIVGEALLNKRPHPELTPWVPPKPTLVQGIYFYQKTHMEELQLEKTKNAIRQVFIDTGITPFEDGRWNQYRRERFTNHTISKL